jgi:hypothetical protein
MIVDGIYREEISKLKKEKIIEYKFIPRSMYDDMLYHKQTTPAYENIFTEKYDSRGAGRVE